MNIYIVKTVFNAYIITIKRVMLTTLVIKTLETIIYKLYLKSNTSKLVENTKVFELTIIKELGKLTP
jgi:hypothetical protein